MVWPRRVRGTLMQAPISCGWRINARWPFFGAYCSKPRKSIPRIVIQSTRDAIELLERLEGRQFSN